LAGNKLTLAVNVAFYRCFGSDYLCTFLCAPN
jgi:hypothetical protein